MSTVCSAAVGKVLKGRGDGRVIDGAVYDARLLAEQILDRARAEAVDIVADADAAQERARQAGRLEGREEGRADIAAEVATIRAAELQRLTDAEDELRVLAVRIAEKILGRELEHGPAAVVDIVRTVLLAARARRRLRVRVHPEDVGPLESATARLTAGLTEGTTLALLADETVARGGCVVETEAGHLDGRIDVQLRAILRALAEEAVP